MRILSLLTFLPSFLFSQPVFQKAFPIDGQNISVAAIRAMPSGNIAVGGGVTSSADGEKTCFVALVNETGALLWAKQWQNNEGNAVVNDILRLPDGGLLAAFGSTTGAEQPGLVRFDAAGQVLWARRLNDDVVFTSLLLLTDGNVLAAGYRTAKKDMVWVKINPDGQTIWSRSHTINNTIDFVQTRDLWEDSAGFLYGTGTFIQWGLGVFGLVYRCSANGEIDWVHSYSRQFAGPESQFARIIPMQQTDRILLGGHAADTSGFRGVWLHCIRTNGTVVWSNMYSLPNNNINLFDLAPNGPGAVFTFGENNGGLSPGLGVATINSSGDLLSARAYNPAGQEAFEPKIARDDQGGFLMADGIPNGGDRNLMVVHTRSDGNFLPCCPKSFNLSVRSSNYETSFPILKATTGPSVLLSSQTVSNLIFDGINDFCPDFNTDFTLSDTLVCPGECITLTWTNPTPGAVYTWLTPGGAADPQDPNRFCYAGDGTFSIVPQVNGCAQNPAAQSIEVNASGNDNVPTAFTPDGDGTNDVFRPLLVCPVTDYRFEIYNRWGNKVFETSDPNEAWDGRMGDNTLAVSDVFVWKLSYRSKTGEGSERKGKVTLVR